MNKSSVIIIVSILLFAFPANALKYELPTYKKIAVASTEKLMDLKFTKEKEPEKGDIYIMPVPIVGINTAYGFMCGFGSTEVGIFGN